MILNCANPDRTLLSRAIMLMKSSGGEGIGSEVRLNQASSGPKTERGAVVAEPPMPTNTDGVAGRFYSDNAFVQLGRKLLGCQ
jgi:hypothetical protein